MSQLRWNPVLKEWLIINPGRKKRPNLPQKQACPFCPGSPEIESETDEVLILPNRFPSLGQPDLSLKQEHPPFESKPGIGRCEVIVYSPSHKTSFGSFTKSRIANIIETWIKRYKELGNLDEIEYVLIFENRGRVIGVSLDHPHGQIYAFPFIPPKIERELQNCNEYFQSHETCLFCDLIQIELKEGTRIVAENEEFVCVVPFYATWPYGTHIYSKKHIQSLLELTPDMKTAFAMILKKIMSKYDSLFGEDLAYELILHQAPTDGKTHSSYHFHVEIYVINRGEGRMKYLGGCELGSGVFVNPTLPEDIAEELRKTKPK